jgi:hypothetical protein
MIQHRKQQFPRKNFPRRPLAPRLRSCRRDLRPSPGEEAAELIGNADGFGGASRSATHGYMSGRN